MYKNVFNIIAVILLYLFLSVAHAGGMKVNPGLWETTSHVSSPGGTHENISQDCIQESEISPEKMMDENSGCQVTDSKADSNSMQWSISCENEGVAMTGDGQAQSSGDSISGGMSIKANFNGQDFVMDTKWEGKRIGECKKTIIIVYFYELTILT